MLDPKQRGKKNVLFFYGFSRGRKEKKRNSQTKKKTKNLPPSLTVLPQLEVPDPPKHGAPDPLRPLHQRPRAPAGHLSGQMLLASHQRGPDAPGTQKHGPAAAEPADQRNSGRRRGLSVDELLRFPFFERTRSRGVRWGGGDSERASATGDRGEGEGVDG